MNLFEEAHKKIPKGMYCYERLEHIPGTDRLNVINKCPFYSFDNFLNLYYCQYMREYGIPNDLSDDEYDGLIRYFGSESELWKQSPLDLLFDMCKCCGVNDGEGADEFE